MKRALGALAAHPGCRSRGAPPAPVAARGVAQGAARGALASALPPASAGPRGAKGLGDVVQHLGALAQHARREAAACAAAALHEEGACFREELRQAVAAEGPSAEEQVEVAVASFERRLEGLLAQSVDQLTRPRPQASDLAVAASAAGALRSSSVAAPPSELSADELEATIRSGFKRLGCSTVAVLERCQLGDRGVGAELPGGLWMHAWISDSSVLWVLPNVPQLSELVRRSELSAAVMTSLLQHGCGRKDSFFLSGQPLTVGYKFGPLHPEILSSPAILGDKLEDTVAMVQQQATILALENGHQPIARVTAPSAEWFLSKCGAVEALSGKTKQADATPWPPAAKATVNTLEEGALTNFPEDEPTVSLPNSGRQQAALRADQTTPATRGSLASPLPSDVCESASAPSTTSAVREPLMAAERLDVAPVSSGGSWRASEEAFATGSTALTAVDAEASPDPRGKEEPAVAASPAARCSVGEPPASSSPQAAASPDQASFRDADKRAADAWFSRVVEGYLEPHSQAMLYVEEAAEAQPFQVSVQDTSQRRVGMEFVKRTNMEYAHFTSCLDCYIAVARARGFAMAVSPHPRGHSRIVISPIEKEPEAPAAGNCDSGVVAIPAADHEAGVIKGMVASPELPEDAASDPPPSTPSRFGASTTPAGLPATRPQPTTPRRPDGQVTRDGARNSRSDACPVAVPALEVPGC